MLSGLQFPFLGDLPLKLTNRQKLHYFIEWFSVFSEKQIKAPENNDLPPPPTAFEALFLKLHYKFVFKDLRPTETEVSQSFQSTFFSELRF